MHGSRPARRMEPLTDLRRPLSRTLAYQALSDGTIEVYDLDFAAYCLMRDLAIADMVEEWGRRPSRFIFTFNGTKDEIRRLAAEYTNSDCAKFADAVRRLKKAVRSTSPREG